MNVPLKCAVLWMLSLLFLFIFGTGNSLSPPFIFSEGGFPLGRTHAGILFLVCRFRGDRGFFFSL